MSTAFPAIARTSTAGEVTRQITAHNRESKRTRYTLIALLLAAIPLAGGVGSWYTSYTTHRVTRDLAATHLTDRVNSLEKGNHSIRKENAKTRLLLLRIARDLSVQMARLHGKAPLPLPSVDAELANALAEVD